MLFFDRMKFKQSPALSPSFVTTGRLVLERYSEQIRDMEMKLPSIKALLTVPLREPVPLMNLPTVTTNVGSTLASSFWFPCPSPLPSSTALKDKGQQQQQRQQYPALVHDQDFQVYRDEFDPHLFGYLPLRNILNLFERSRSNTWKCACMRLREWGISRVVTGRAVANRQNNRLRTPSPVKEIEGSAFLLQAELQVFNVPKKTALVPVTFH